MKYLVRSLKYFVQLIIMLALFLVILVLLKVIDADIDTMFVGGVSSLWKIAGIVAVFAAIYPRFGYASRRIFLAGDFSEASPAVKEEMSVRGYVLEKTEGENMTFRIKSHVARFTRFWEDRITMTRTMNGWEIEGPAKDVSHIVSGFAAKAQDQADD